ncbi:hypothetical protein AcW1_003605 [Taiwanofungus camphoratus]|nr:hypothetical protein AcV5_007299 [Antrodia cinnamomea]KAI0940403.1 hypothetical protein AcW1_003605 [Antrodia cinnamomea]
MMFRTVLVLAFALSALSAPQSSSSQCDSGTIQCCDTVAPAYSASVAPVLKALKINVDDENKQVALGCGGSAVGVGAGSSCTSAPICCENNYFGLIGIGCISITL